MEVAKLVKNISKEIESYEKESIEVMKTIVKYPAIAPENGGNGEWEKAKVIQTLLEKFGFDEIKILCAKNNLNIDKKITKGNANFKNRYCCNSLVKNK